MNNAMNNINNVNMNNNNNPNQFQNNNANNQIQNNPPKSFNTVDFLYVNQAKGKTTKIMVQGNSSMTFQNLVNNFRTKLCDDSIVIQQYLLNDTIPIPADSNQNISSLGIDDKSVIKALG